MCGRIIQASGPIRYMSTILTERFLRRTLIVIALGGLVLGLLTWVVVAVMYAGGNVLEDFAIARAERDLKSLIDRAPRIAHRRQGSSIADIPIEKAVVGDVILVRAGEVIPIDGIIISSGAMIDEAVLTGEPIPVTRREGESTRSGTVNVGETFEIRAIATAGESTYAGMVGCSMRLRPQRQRLPASRIVMRYCCFQSLSSSLAVPGFCRATPFEDWPCWSPRPHVR